MQSTSAVDIPAEKPLQSGCFTEDFASPLPYASCWLDAPVFYYFTAALFSCIQLNLLQLLLPWEEISQWCRFDHNLAKRFWALKPYRFVMKREWGIFFRVNYSFNYHHILRLTLCWTSEVGWQRVWEWRWLLYSISISHRLDGYLRQSLRLSITDHPHTLWALLRGTSNHPAKGQALQEYFREVTAYEIIVILWNM